MNVQRLVNMNKRTNFFKFSQVNLLNGNIQSFIHLIKLTLWQMLRNK